MSALGHFPKPYTYADVAARWQGVDVERVAAFVSLLGLRGQVLDVPSVQLLERELRGRGYKSALVCECGAIPSAEESAGTGEYDGDDGARLFLCLTCWCAVNYGRGATETLEARRQARKGAGS